MDTSRKLAPTAEPARKAPGRQARHDRPPRAGDRRRCVATLACFLAAGSAWGAPQALASQAPPPAPVPEVSPAARRAVLHVVLFELRAEAPAQAAEALMRDARTLLARIPGVLEVRTGRPAADGRAVHVKDYDVGLSVLLADLSALDAYAAHPLHAELIAKHDAHIARLRVIDFFGE